VAPDGPPRQPPWDDAVVQVDKDLRDAIGWDVFTSHDDDDDGRGKRQGQEAEGKEEMLILRHALFV